MPAAQFLAQTAVLAQLAAPYPFSVGETLSYEAKLGYFSVGTASVSVNRLVRERGTEAFEITMNGQGGPPGWRVSYDLTSRVGTARFHSLRFHRRMVQRGDVDEERFVIVPDSARYREEGKPGDWVAPPEPLDELAFLYYLRTVPLEVGRSYSLERYFKTGYNPVGVEVTGRESVSLPGGGRLRLRADFPIPDNWTIFEKAVARGLKKYGALVADNGNFFSISVTSERLISGSASRVAQCSRVLTGSVLARRCR